MAPVLGLQGGVEGLVRAGGAAAGAQNSDQRRRLFVLAFGSEVAGFSHLLIRPNKSTHLLTSSSSVFFRKYGRAAVMGGGGAAPCCSSGRIVSEGCNFDDSGSLALLRRKSCRKWGAEAGFVRRVECCCVDDSGTESSGTESSGTGPQSASDDYYREDLVQQQQPYGIPATSVPDRWDVVGLGQAMVDFSAVVEDGFLHGLGLVKGTRKVVNHEERGKVLRALDGCSYKVTAGGSLSNTLVALARLGTGYNGDLPLNVAMTGSVGSDPLGDFYRTKLLRANVHFLSQPIADGTTGTVTVCTTPDAQRTMLSYQGMSSIVNFDEALEKQISMSRVLVVEGYLWELSETIETIARACRRAREQGILVALTASDVSCVNRHREKMWDVMAGSVDILFTNADEARALLGCDSSTSPANAAKLLSIHCPLVSVTDGDRGSYIGLKGEMSYVQPSACVPVDTCGAGDAYAAGVLYGLLRGVPDLKGIGNLAARVAAVVVGQQGTRLREEDARGLATSIPTISCKLEGLNLSINTETEQSVNA